jgi:hypothetical protein
MDEKPANPARVQRFVRAPPHHAVSSATSLALKAKPFKPRLNEQVLPLICGAITSELTRPRGGANCELRSLMRNTLSRLASNDLGVVNTADVCCGVRDAL